MRHENEHFENQNIELDGNEYINCTFNNVNFIYRGGGICRMEGANIEGFTFTFEDCANNTVDFLRNLYQGGFQESIEATFDLIRGNVAAPPPPNKEITIKLGTDEFITNRPITLIGIGENGRFGMGGIGIHPNAIVWVDYQDGNPTLNANILDADHENVLQIRNNIITYNKDNIYRLEVYPDNQIPPDRVVIINQSGERALDLTKTGQGYVFHADFYYAGQHVVVNDGGLVLNPGSYSVE